MKLPERIRHAREAAGLNQTQLGEAIGMESHAAVSRYEAGKREPTLGHLLKIADACRVDAAWLILGKGEVQPEAGAATPAAIVHLHEGLVELGGAEWASVPRYDASLSAGPGAIVDPQAEPLGFHLFEMQWLRALTRSAPENLAVVKVDGDSMEPTLRDGDWVLVDRDQKRINREGVYALAVGDAAWVKRITLNLRDKLIQVISDNSQYPVQELTEDDLCVIGRVVWIVGRKV